MKKTSKIITAIVIVILLIIIIGLSLGLAKEKQLHSKTISGTPLTPPTIYKMSNAEQTQPNRLIGHRDKKGKLYIWKRLGYTTKLHPLI